MTQEQRELISNTITIDDLRAIQDNHAIVLIAELCGIDVARKLIAKCGGVSIYIPNLHRIPQLMRRTVLQHYNGNNTQQVALDMGLSERYIRKLIKGDEYVS